MRLGSLTSISLISSSNLNNMNKKNTMTKNKLTKNWEWKKCKNIRPELIRVNMPNMRPGHDTKLTQSKINWIKLWNSITKQLNIKGWN
jgi:hypothetical protein